MNWNFDILCETVARYLGWDVDGMIPTFVSLAENRLQRECKLRGMERRATYVTKPGNEAVALPDKRLPGDWDVFVTMREISLRTNPPVNLRYVSPDSFTDLSSRKGMPVAYTIVGRDLLLAPVPDAPYTLLLTYYAQIPPLSAQQPTNDILLAYPDLYLYAVLMESVPYSRSIVPLEIWAEYYRAAQTDAQKIDSTARFSNQIAARAPRSYH